MKTLVNKNNPQIRITAPEIKEKLSFGELVYEIKDKEDCCLLFDETDWTLVEEEETTKIADSILPSCTANAKSQNRWHKVSDSLPDTPREVLCKDAIGNYFIGRYYGKEPWEVSVYDDTDKTNEYNPPVVEWTDILVEEEPTEGIKGNLEEIPLNVDLEKEIEKAQEHYFALKDKGFSLDSMDVSVIARHFYELGLNARKEE